MSWLIFGSGGHAAVIVDLLAVLKAGRIIGLLDDDPRRRGHLVGGYNVIGTIAQAKEFSGKYHVTDAVIAVGQNTARHRLGLLAQEAGLVCLPLVHPSAVMSSHVGMSEGCVVMAHATVQADVHLHPWCIVNTGACVDHGCCLQRGVHVGPGAVLAGNVMVGEFALIGAGAVVIPNVNIGVGAVVGAGAVVIRDVPVGATVVGCPARALPGRTGEAPAG